MQVALLGDVMLGRLVNQRLRTAGPDCPWGDTVPLLRKADVRFGNLECVLADGGQPQPGKVFHFRSDVKNVRSLRHAEINVVSLANNHVLDFGAGAFREMLTALDVAGIQYAGAGLDRAAARRPTVRQVAGTTVGFLAFTDNEPAWEASDTSPGVYFVPVEAGGVVADDGGRRAAELLELVRRTRTEVELLIVSAHWGPNWGARPPSGHQELAQALIDAGADVVFGHSAHIFRGVGLYRQRPIIYGAGDFVDDYAVDPVERNDQSFVFILETLRNTPCTLRLHPALIVDFQARLAQGRDARTIARRMQGLCGNLGTGSFWNAEGGFLEIPIDQEPRR